MPLHRADDAFDADMLEGILFPMTDGKTRIIYRVSYEALQDLASADGDGSLDTIACFERHRTEIEEIASEKFDAGNPERIIRTNELTPRR
jgi:hypothetical protein